MRLTAKRVKQHLSELVASGNTLRGFRFVDKNHIWLMFDFGFCVQTQINTLQEVREDIRAMMAP